MPPRRAARLRCRAVAAFVLTACLVAPVPALARIDKPTVAAEEFFRLLAMEQYDQAAELLSTADHQALEQLKTQGGAPGQDLTLARLLSDSFFLLQGQDNAAMMEKFADGETLMPQRIAFYVPGQHYIIGNFAAVFTRETYLLSPDDTGAVREDPRKLWIDPTNVLSQVRDEAYFKQWWIWEDERLTMPGLIWLVKEGSQWKVDLYSGQVPRMAFREILRWHFGRDVFTPEGEEQGVDGAPQGAAPGGGAPQGGGGSQP